MKMTMFTALLLVAACLSGCKDTTPDGQPLKIMNWNICAGKGMDGVRDISRAAAVIKSVNADIVALQEVDRNTARSGGIDQIAELEKKTGLVATWCKAIDFDGGEYGITLLSREKPVRTQKLKLPLLGKNEQRMLLVAEFAGYTVGATHLSLLPEERLAAVEVIRGYVSSDKPFFLAGDLNDTPQSGFIQKLGESFTMLSGSEPTHPSPMPKRCIDYIAVSSRHRGQCRDVKYEVLPEAVISDHRPVIVTLRSQRRR